MTVYSHFALLSDFLHAPLKRRNASVSDASYSRDLISCALSHLFLSVEDSGRVYGLGFVQMLKIENLLT